MACIVDIHLCPCPCPYSCSRDVLLFPGLAWRPHPCAISTWRWNAENDRNADCDKKTNRILNEGCYFSDDGFSLLFNTLRWRCLQLVPCRFLYSPKDPGLRKQKKQTNKQKGVWITQNRKEFCRGNWTLVQNIAAVEHWIPKNEVARKLHFFFLSQ